MFKKGGMAQRTNYMGGGIKTVRPESAGSGMTGIMSGIVGRQPFRLGQMAESRPGATFRPKYVPVQKYVTGSYEGDKELELQDALGVEDLGEFTTQKGVTKFKEDPEYTGGSPITEIEKVKEKPKKTIIQQLEDTPSDQDTIKSYMDMFQEALGTDEDSTNRERYLQLARFGANLLAQPGGDLVGAVGRAAAPSIEGLAKTEASAKSTDRQVKLAAIKTAIDKMDDPTLDKIKSIAKAANLPIEEVAKSFVETAQEGKTKESIITTNRDGMKGEIGEGPALKAARTMAEAGLNFALFNLLPVNKDGSVKEDTPNGYYYDEKGELSVIKDGVKSAIKIKAKE
tara:strand:- start:105 stop:1127 length:1023 start_codon:yes stop_codon:yes gene_type:complete